MYKNTVIDDNVISFLKTFNKLILENKNDTISQLIKKEYLEVAFEIELMTDEMYHSFLKEKLGI